MSGSNSLQRHITIPCLVAQGIWPEVVEPNCFFDAGTVMSAAGPTNFPVCFNLVIRRK